MKRGRRVVVGIAACVVVATVAALVWPREPVYQGKKLSEWLEAYGGVHPSEEAGLAVRRMGTNALPFLVSWIGYTEPAWRVKAVNWCSRAHWQRGMDYVWKGVVRGEDRAEMALSGFAILGDEASPAVPELVSIMNRWRTDPSRRAIQALHYLGTAGLPPLLTVVTNEAVAPRFRDAALTSIGDMLDLGTNAAPAVPNLVRCLDDPAFAQNAAEALGKLAVDSEHVVPALVVSMGRYKRGSEVRYSAILALAKFGDRAQAAVPALLSLVTYPAHELGPADLGQPYNPKAVRVPDVSMSHAAAYALEQIAPELWQSVEHKEKLVIDHAR